MSDTDQVQLEMASLLNCFLGISFGPLLGTMAMLPAACIASVIMPGDLGGPLTEEAILDASLIGSTTIVLQSEIQMRVSSQYSMSDLLPSKR